MYIPNVWYAIADSNEVKPGKPYAFKRLGHELVLWRDQENRIVVMHDRCPHRSAKLSPGKIINGNIQCHFHGFQYNRDGGCELIPANGRSGPRPKVFQCGVIPSHEAYGLIWMWNGEPQAEYPPVPFFDDLDDYVYATFQTTWNAHYTRSLEGLLDVSHLPFVHANTIGRGNLTLVNGPYTTLQDNELRAWMSNQPDVGLPALKPTQLPPPNKPADLWLNFPNMWRLRLTDQLSQVIAAAPIDDDYVHLYVRTYQRFVTAPVIGRLVAEMSNLFNRYVVKEDQEIIESQSPKISDLNIGERFIPGDRPIALYLQRRRELILGEKSASLRLRKTQPEAIDPAQISA